VGPSSSSGGHPKLATTLSSPSSSPPPHGVARHHRIRLALLSLSPATSGSWRCGLGLPLLDPSGKCPTAAWGGHVVWPRASTRVSSLCSSAGAQQRHRARSLAAGLPTAGLRAVGVLPSVLLSLAVPRLLRAFIAYYGEDRAPSGQRAGVGHERASASPCAALLGRSCCNTSGVKHCISIPNHEHEHQLHL
jgi:hypothetical protein